MASWTGDLLSLLLTDSHSRVVERTAASRLLAWLMVHVLADWMLFFLMIGVLWLLVIVVFSALWCVWTCASSVSSSVVG